MDVFAVTGLALRMSGGKQRVHKTAIAKSAAPLAVSGDVAGSWTRRRRISVIMRLACRVSVASRNRSVGRLGGAASVSAVLVAYGFSCGTPALAQTALSGPGQVNTQGAFAGGNGVAIGSGATATNALGGDPIAIGQAAQAVSTTGGGSPIAIGAGASATSTGTIEATAIGNSASANYTGATALGFSATAGALNATALGQGATASNANAVALGYNSVTAAAVATSSITINGTKYSFAGVSPGSTVSIGDWGRSGPSLTSPRAASPPPRRTRSTARSFTPPTRP